MQLQIWIHFVYRSHFLTASAAPRCLRAWTIWLQSTYSSSREGNTPLKYEFPHMSKFRRKHSNRAPACVHMCGGGGKRQAGLSVCLHFEKLLCFHAEGRALRVWRCCRVTASRAFPVSPRRQIGRQQSSWYAACWLTICYISVRCQRRPCCESTIRLQRMPSEAGLVSS